MTDIALCNALCDFIKVAVKDFRSDDRDARGLSSVGVYAGWLPPKKGSIGEEFPFVIVRPASGFMNDGSCGASIEIIIGTYSKDYDGFKDAVNLLTRIKTALADVSGRLLNDRFQLEMPMEWELSEDQPYPSWTATLKTNWTWFPMSTVTENDNG